MEYPWNPVKNDHYLPDSLDPDYFFEKPRLTTAASAHVEDPWIADQVALCSISQLEDCAVAVDAAYYFTYFLDNPPFREPLLSALGGLTGIQSHIEGDLDNWAANKTTPFFIFDGLSVVGQDEVSVQRGKRATAGTDEAWSLYFQSQAQEAVDTFGRNRGAFIVQQFFPLLQRILRRRGLHFLVPPSNASAQLAYFDAIESEQCSAIMGSQELLLYPIRDAIIRVIDWDSGHFQALLKKNIIKTLNVSETMFVDALLMTGTSFLPTFPPLQDNTITPRQHFTVQDAVNMLRTSDKAVASACNSFSDILQSRDPDWLQKYRKAKLSVDHYIFIDETGEVKVNDFDTLTNDNWEYLGYQLPPEILHYMNTGLISARTLNWICHGQIIVQPTLDGVRADEYKKLVTDQLMPLREAALSMLLPRFTRGIQYKPVAVKVWYDDKYSHQITYRPGDNQTLAKSNTWTIKEPAIKEHYPDFKYGSVFSEVMALKDDNFAKTTIKTEKVKGVNSANLILSLTIWRFLHLRGYVDDSHHLTAWGKALATSLEEIEPVTQRFPEVQGLFEAVVLAFELLRFGLLNTDRQHPELNGLPMNGSASDKASLLLISRCAILLKLRHQANGYTGPLSKNFLFFRSLCSSVREANRDLTEAIVASLFLFAQSTRDRDDYLDIGQRLPFLMDTDVALAIAVKTLLDESQPSDTPGQKAARKQEFPSKFVPYATNFQEDLEVAFGFFDAIHAGVKTLEKEVPVAEREAWTKAASYLKLRR